jgi:bacillithiol biosynthesis cysteine-adding enzyme BshC
MGSEDADLAEIGTLTVGGEKLVWETNQTGAVGRMIVDENLLKLIDRIHGQIGVNEFGAELTQIFKVVYTLGKTIQQASLELVNILFQQFGLLILIPDNSLLKEEFNQIVNKEIEFNFSTKLLQRTINQLSKHYKVQTAGREINLFYLYENHRERIEQEGELFVVKKLHKSFQLIEIQEEIKKYPERFSANVILRGVFQETILPNIVFIGGGGELAYWLELKEIFKSANVPYPVLVLRNSFLLISKKQQQVIVNHGIELTELFLKEFDLIQKKVLAASNNQLNISDEIDQISRLYTQIEHLATLVDGSLTNHIQALKTKALHKLAGVEKKMIRAEKRNFSLLNTQIHQLKLSLFPNESLQERVENFSLFYSKHGKNWLNTIYQASLALEQQFTVVFE